MTRTLRVLSIVCALLPGVAFAQDVVVAPGPAGDFIVELDDDGGGDFVLKEPTQFGITLLRFDTSERKFFMTLPIPPFTETQVAGIVSASWGLGALGSATIGTNSAAFGTNALTSSTTGAENSAFGVNTLHSLVTGSRNAAVGYQAASETTADENSAFGYKALYNNSTGSRNIGIGTQAGSNLTSGNDNIFIGNLGSASSTGQIVIGNTAHTDTFIEGIFGSTSSGGTAVFINSANKLGTATSSARFKRDVRDMGDGSELLMQLRPVTFRYREGVSDDAQLLQYGLVAEEVAKVAPGLVMNDEHGDPYTVRYQFLAPMLLNEAQQQRRVIEEQRTRIEDLTARLERLEALIASQRVASR